MKVLIVCSGNAGRISPYIQEQVDSLKRFDIAFDYYSITGKGIPGYISNLNKLSKKILGFKPDLIHAHYGLSGFLTMLVRHGFPLITTFHGSDINPIDPTAIKPNVNKFLSRINHNFTNHSIFVNKDLAKSIGARKDRSTIIPCQVDLEKFFPLDRSEARAICKFSSERRYILFSSSFDNNVKNYPLAKNACSAFNNVELIELKGYSREEVNLLLNACDLALVTSFSEGSSQFVKEAMATNCPIVSTQVGDAEMIFGDLNGCYISNFQTDDVILRIREAFQFNIKRTKGRQRIIQLELDAKNTSQKIYNLYLKVIGKCSENGLESIKS